MTGRVPWNNDRCRTKSSIEILVDWLADGNNVSRWQSGIEPKTRLIKEVARLLRAQDLRHRTAGQVRSMLGRILKSVE